MVDDKVEVALREQASREFWKSVVLKVLFLVVSALALGLIVLLDKMKTTLHDTTKKPYAHEAIVAAIGKSGSEALTKAAADPHLTGKRYATPEEAFVAINQFTQAERDLRTRTNEITDRYKSSLVTVDAEIARLLGEKEKSKDIALQLAVRTTLTNARTAELNEAQQAAASARAALKWSYDDVDFGDAKTHYVFFHEETLDAVGARIVDPDDPLNVIYDSLWYGALIIGVLTFAALVLSPVFRAIPLAGVDDSMAERLKTLIARGPRMMRTASGIAAAAVGAAVIVGAAAALPSSPLREAGLAPDNAYSDDAEKRLGAQTPPNTTTATATATDTGDGSTITTTDTGMEGLRHDLTLLQQTLSDHDSGDTSHGVLVAMLKTRPVDPDDLVRRMGEQFDGKVGALGRTLAARDTAIQSKFDETQRLIASDIKPAVQHTELLTESLDSRVTAMDKNVTDVGNAIGARAAGIEDVAFLPNRLGERPSAVAALVGFDRYRVTEASTSLLEKLQVPTDVNAVVATLGTSVHSGDDVRRALRRGVCPPTNQDCPAYRTWINRVLRATRTN